MKAGYAYEDCGGEPDEGAPDWRTLRSAAHTARKPHPCDCCEGRIEPGERYRMTVALDEGKLTVMRAHVRACWEDREANEAARQAEIERIYAEEAAACQELYPPEGALIRETVA